MAGVLGGRSILGECLNVRAICCIDIGASSDRNIDAGLTSVQAQQTYRGENHMKPHALAFVALSAVLLGGPAVHAQPAPAANPLDVIPEKMPFDVPYGAPIALDRAQAVVAAAVAEATKRNWKMNVAVVDSGGNLVAFARMDGAQLASIAISEHKARAAVTFRRETKVFENGIQSGLTYVLSLDGIIASRGGIPLIEDGKMIGAIGVSGGAGAQDEVCSKAGAATINK
jgi:glc operon protein GlcG